MTIQVVAMGELRYHGSMNEESHEAISCVSPAYTSSNFSCRAVAAPQKQL